MLLCLLLLLPYIPFSLPARAEEDGYDLNHASSVTTSVQYWNSKTSAWESIPSDVAADSSFRITMDFKIFTSELVNHDGKLLYTIPEPFRGLPREGQLTDGTQQIGTVTVTEHYILLDYDYSKLNTGHSYFQGNCRFEATLNTDDLPEDGLLVIDKNHINISIQLEQDAFYKYAGLHVDKKVSDTVGYDPVEKYYYLDYTLKLTAEQDLSKALIIDRFTENLSSIDSYVGVGKKETPANVQQSGSAQNTVYLGKRESSYSTAPEPSNVNPGVLVWSAYDLQKDETRTLTYRVRLKDQYADQPANLQNTAEAYSASTSQEHDAIYLQNSQSAVFQAYANIRLSKTDSTVHTTADGREYAEHTVTITAPDNNTFPLKNVVIHDWYDSSTKGKLVYDWNSFTLNGKSITAVQGTESWGNCAEISLSRLEPGQVMTLKYRVWIDPKIYLSSSGFTSLTNSVQAVVNNVWQETKETAKITPIGKQWMRKNAVSAPTSSQQTITMNGTVYDRIGSPSDIREYVVPQKSYQYQVIVNETGGWDVSNAVFQDTFESNMTYVGYVKVEAFDVSKLSISTSANFSQATQALNACPIVKTAWLNIDGKSSFSFRPSDIGFPSNNYAYRLTYYAQPIRNITMTAKNSFALSGTVGKGNSNYTLSVGSTRIDLSITGSQQCTLKKQSWYFTIPGVEENHYDDRATQYWVVSASGDLIEGLKIRDTPSNSNTIVKPDSVVGVYIGSSDTEFDGYSFRAEHLSDPETLSHKGLTALTEGKDYLADGGIVTLLRNIILKPDQQMFVIYRTRFNYDITKYSPSSYFTVRNQVYYSYDNGTSWRYAHEATQIVSNQKGSTKNSDTVYVYNGSQWSELNTQKKVSLPAPPDKEPGLYASWLIRINILGTNKGKATITDTLPEGLELTYVSLQSIGSWLDYNEPIPADPEEDFLSGLSYTEMPMQNEGIYLARNPNNPYVLDGEKVYYDKTKRTAVWAIEHLRIQNDKVCENYFVNFRVVCKIKNPDMRSGEDVSFTNHAEITSVLGNEPLSDTLHYSVSSLEKTGDKNHAVVSGVYPFTIHANPQGLDLDPNSNTITLVDEMSSSLSFRPETLVITDTSTGESLNPSQYHESYYTENDKTIIELTLPDSKPLTIQYQARITAAPGTKIPISNSAYWKGYTSQAGSNVADNNFQYEVSGSGSTHSTYGTLQITKKSAANVSGQALSGAVYSLYPVTLDRNNQPVLGKELIGNVSERQGVYTYDFLMYNTIYCVKEMQAPSGYLIDEIPHYIAIADTRDSLKYHQMLTDIDKLQSSGIHVNGEYSSDVLELMLTDELDVRYSLTVRKIDGDNGKPLEGVGFTLYREVSPSAPDAVPLQTTDGIKYCIPAGEEKQTQLDAQGYASVSFAGCIGNGRTTYYLQETHGLLGYLAMNNAIPIQAEAIQNVDDTITWKAYVKGIETPISDGKLTISLSNYAKLTMPAAGWLHSSVFYLTVGFLIIALAFGMLLLKEKKQVLYIIKQFKLGGTK